MCFRVIGIITPKWRRQSAGGTPSRGLWIHTCLLCEVAPAWPDWDFGPIPSLPIIHLVTSAESCFVCRSGTCFAHKLPARHLLVPPKKEEKKNLLHHKMCLRCTFNVHQNIFSCAAAAGRAGRRPWALILSWADTCCPAATPAAATNNWLLLTFAHTCPRPHHLFSPLLCPLQISRAAFTCWFISLAGLKLMHEHQQCRTSSTRADRMNPVCKIFQ